jgi:hypothetical protein
MMPERESAVALPRSFYFREECSDTDASWIHPLCREGSGRRFDGRRSDDRVRFLLPDEYQDGVSAGSLVEARRCWLNLSDADTLRLPQLFTFDFHCPTQRMALGLLDFLRYTPYAGFVRTTDRAVPPQGDTWQVSGTTHATVWSLPSLEHLFMRLRGAGSRYESALVTLDLQPISQCLH